MQAKKAILPRNAQTATEVSPGMRGKFFNRTEVIRRNILVNRGRVTYTSWKMLLMFIGKYWEGGNVYCQLFCVNSLKGRNPSIVTVLVNGVNVTMEIDTGTQ